MKVLMVQTPVIDNDIQASVDLITRSIQEWESKADLIVFPESVLGGFPSIETIKSCALTPTDAPIQTIAQYCKKHQTAVLFGYAEKSQVHFYNSAMLINKQGEIALNYRKTHLWGPTDLSVFTPGNTYHSYEFMGFNIGVLICFDIEFPGPATVLRQMHTDVLIVLDGNMTPYERVHDIAALARASDNQMYTILVNRVGDNQGLTFKGGSLTVSPSGEILSKLADHPETGLVHINKKEIEQARSVYNYLELARLKVSMK